MAGSTQVVEIDGHRIKLSNLEKVLYPEDEIIKAEVIQYYLKIAPYFLRHNKYRPLSLVRYPDGISSHEFFQKDRPSWAPDWIESIRLGKEEKKDYIFLTNAASLVWLANLACLELHIMEFTKQDPDHPDLMVFDLDPAPEMSFDQVKQIAYLLKEHLLEFEYHPFVKTSGGKGLHLFCPIAPSNSHGEVFQAAKDLSESFIKKYPQLGTLQLRKDKREQKLLIDIYRNRETQTVVGAYSLRGKPGAPVSMPVSWEMLGDIQSSQAFQLRQAADHIEHHGDAWEGMHSQAVPIHTHRQPKLSQPYNPEGLKHKTPEQLEEYAAKRDFSTTPEPPPAVTSGTGHAFVVHRHHATSLHYDLRLEKDGVLLSWAIPRGLPPEPGIKRLAVETEPHPLAYLTFEGEIPKGQYGAGSMWIFASGQYRKTKEKKDGFYFQLTGSRWEAEFRIHHMKDKEWLLERVSPALHHPYESTWQVMLAEQTTRIPTGSDYRFEVKWDGIRALLLIFEGTIRILSRNGRELTQQFPELVAALSYLRASNAVLDAEIVRLDAVGRPVFKQVISRLHQSHPAKIERLSKSAPVVCYLFDALYLDGRSLLQDPLIRRRAWVQDLIKPGSPFRFSSDVEDGAALYEAAQKMGLEGIMAKKATSYYYPGKRSADWYKLKFRETMDCYIAGFTEGQGERSSVFGALHLLQKNEQEWIYRGKVGTGFDMDFMQYLRERMDGLPKTIKPFETPTSDDKVSTWIAPELVCEVEYASITDQGTLREPVFKSLLEDR